MPTILIAGATRGIGLQFARSYAADGSTVIGTARRSGDAAALSGTGAEVRDLDIADSASIDALAATLAGRPLDLLIVNAGIYGGDTLDPGTWLDVLKTNTIGPTLLLDALKPNLAAGEGKRAIAITSEMGSIADASSGHVPYRTSKTALNMAWKCLAQVLAKDGITAAVIHPGWVKTDMGGPNASITADKSVAGMRRAIDALAPAQSGQFLSWDGRAIPW